MKKLICLLLSVVIVAFSVISLSSGPIINKTIPKSTEWAYGNCQYLSDQEEKATDLNSQYSVHREKTLCRRRKAMYGLEYASFIFDVICGFVCTLLFFLRYLNIGKGTDKNTGLVGLITGVVGFVLTFLYFVYSAYIFTNDTYKDENDSGITKLFPNGASVVAGTGAKPYQNDKDDDAEYIKYYELGQKQYNYDTEYARLFNSGGGAASYRCYKTRYQSSPTPCEYGYDDPTYEIKNKYLYDKWVNTLIFSFVISVCNIGLIIFGLLLFLEGNKDN